MIFRVIKVCVNCFWSKSEAKKASKQRQSFRRSWQESRVVVDDGLDLVMESAHSGKHTPFAKQERAKAGNTHLHPHSTWLSAHQRTTAVPLWRGCKCPVQEVKYQ